MNVQKKTGNSGKIVAILQSKVNKTNLMNFAEKNDCQQLTSTKIGKKMVFMSTII